MSISTPRPLPDRAAMPYRDCAGVALFNREGLVFIGSRRPGRTGLMDHTWQMPQGGIDTGEDPVNAALRELYEETGVRSALMIRAAPGWISYDLPDAALGVALKGRYRGQRQRWYAMEFSGDDAEIDVLAPGGGAHPAEFDDWRWERLDRLPELVVPFKRPAYEQIVAAFADIPDLVRADGSR